MTSFLYALKGEATILNLVIALLIMAFFFNRYQKSKTATVLSVVALVIFLICSIPWLPNYLAGKLENKYLPLSLPINNLDTAPVLIHILGSGNNLDKRLPANAQLGLTALGRLAEGIRIYRSYKNSTIICSGYSALGLETQAEVTKKAAIILGVNPARIETLNKPSTTLEEAKELSYRFTKRIKLIIVTDALHMPRAIKYFRSVGFNPIAAPTNYRVNEGPVQEGFSCWPSIEKISLMNYIIHEWLGNMKSAISGY